MERAEKIDIPPVRAKTLNKQLNQKQVELEKEITHLKSTPYELTRNDGTKEYCSLCYLQFIKKN
ncbi:hypothetical protein C6B37_02585 [Candidatus Phytoplasma phoenicium]|uniref:Uncharacterized protein n=1 Tax=Candidatus Phytoplasma phoenicium TaxID=198422 RepID=A0A2S8NT75_9MOLU|nr:hypothetical protein C6B37_02585 [Candidatus Phytoplasma phoenicium]